MNRFFFVFFSLVIWVANLNAFEIRTGVKDYGYRIVFDGVKEVEIYPISNTVILKINDEIKTPNLKLDPRFINSLEITKDSERKKTVIFIDFKDNLSMKTFALKGPDRYVIDFIRTVNIAKYPEHKKIVEKNNNQDILDRILKNLESLDKDSEFIEVPSFYAGKKRVIVIDPGHGGHDPGAIANGLKEKDINLKVALSLKSYLAKDPRFKVYLTRDNDTFIPLYDRTLVALEKKADLFISIHTNASENPNLSGTYLYTLNLRGATSKLARMVEERENKTVLKVIKVSANPSVNKIVADMAISHTMTEGLNFAKFIEKNFTLTKSQTEFKRVESANFAVLKTPSIPAVLVEIAFITNENDAKLLADNKFLNDFAKKLYKSTVDYFFKYRNLVFKEGEKSS